jgi:hypothetical protein
MGDLWQDEGFGSAGGVGEANGEDDWDEGEESLELSLENGFDDPADADELEDDEGWDDAEG